MRRYAYSFATLLLLAAGLTLSSGCSCTDDEQNELPGPGAGNNGSGNSAASGGTGGSAASAGMTLGGFGGAGNSGGGTAASGGVGGVDEQCLFIPEPGEFTPQLDCAWDGPGGGSAYPWLDDVVSTPVVVNLTDDNNDGVVDMGDIPDIAFVSYQLQRGVAGGPSWKCPADMPATMRCGCCSADGVLRVVSGACEGDALVEHFTVGATEIEADGYPAGIFLDNSGHLAAGDIDSDGSVDLVATIRAGGTIAFERNGDVKWHQPDHPIDVDHRAGTTPSIADLDADGMPEVILGRVVLNGEDGSLAWRGDEGLGTNGFMGPVSAVGDVDLDGKLNVMAGNTLYDENGVDLWSYAYPSAIVGSGGGANCQHSGYPCDGFTATGNFDSDMEGEIVIVRAGVIYVLNHDGTPLNIGGVDVLIDIPKIDCWVTEGGPPTVADFDGDGEAEIGAAGSDYYVVADLECLATPLPAFCSDRGIRWKLPNNDCSSRVTGSSVFDFDGDGKAEVVYNDETLFRILDGTTGAVLRSMANRSHTRLEMPIVVDVDNDGNSEIVFIENGGSCQGIQVWADAADTWVPTRRIWNQHAYHVTNVDEFGNIPQFEEPNWLRTTDATVSGFMNNFRQNLPDFSVFAAPDLTVTLDIDRSSCPASIGLDATVCNQGLLQVGAGVPVLFYDNDTQTEIVCANGPIVTSFPLEPGACETLTCVVDPPPEAPQTIDARACVDNPGYDCLPITTGAGGAGGSAGSGGAGGSGGAAGSGGSGGASSVDDNGTNSECHEDNNSADDSELGCENVPS